MGAASCARKTRSNHILTRNGIPPQMSSITDVLQDFGLDDSSIFGDFRNRLAAR